MQQSSLSAIPRLCSTVVCTLLVGVAELVTAKSDPWCLAQVGGGHICSIALRRVTANEERGEREVYSQGN